MAKRGQKIQIKIDDLDFYWYGEVNESGQAHGIGELYDLDDTLRFRGLTENEINRIATVVQLFMVGSEELANKILRENAKQLIIERERIKKLMTFDKNMVCKDGKLYNGILFGGKYWYPNDVVYHGGSYEMRADESVFNPKLDLEQYLAVNSKSQKKN